MIPRANVMWPIVTQNVWPVIQFDLYRKLFSIKYIEQEKSKIFIQIIIERKLWNAIRIIFLFYKVDFWTEEKLVIVSDCTISRNS